MTKHIGTTASITLITGLPGSGKSLRLAKYIKEAGERGEVVFCCNVNGLKLPHVPFEDPREWRDIPAGSVLVVDEAQQFFRTRRGGDAPEYLTAMETIRHEGVRLVLATQQPDYLDTHLRGLVGLHEHLLRVNGKQASKIWRHNEVMDNVRSERARARYDSETWTFPTELFDAYESAQVHTVKATLSSRMKRGLVMAAVAVALVVGAVWMFKSTTGADAQARTAAAPDPAGRGDAPAPGQVPPASRPATALEKHEPQAIAEYMANLQPRAPSLPWSAPIYDERQAVAQPRVFCIASGEGYNGRGEWKEASVHCQTEQGTRVVMDERQARAIARWGESYNPFKPPPMDAGSARGVLEHEEPAPRVAPMPGTVRGGAGTVGRPMVAPEFGTITRPSM